MENNNVNQQVNPVEMPAQPPYNPLNNHRGNFLIIVGLLVLLIMVGVGAYFLGSQNAKPTQLTQQNNPSPSITSSTQPTISPATLDTADWETYTNTKYGYTIKYPEGFGIDEMEGVTIIFKGDKLKTPPNSPIDPYPTSLAIYNRTNANSKNADEACEAEACQNLNDPVVGQNYKKEKVQINNASGVKLTSVDRKYSLDYYLANATGSRILRISLGANMAESSSVTNESEQSEGFNSLQQILSTFTFIK